MTAITRWGLVLAGVMLMLTTWRLQRVTPAPNTCQAILTYTDTNGDLHAWSSAGHDVILGGGVRNTLYTTYSMEGGTLLVSDGLTIRRTTLAAHSLEPWLTDATRLLVADGQVYFTRPTSSTRVAVMRAAVMGHEQVVVGEVWGQAAWLGTAPDGTRFYFTAYSSTAQQTAIYEVTLGTDALRLIRTLDGKWKHADTMAQRGGLALLMRDGGYGSDGPFGPNSITLVDTTDGQLYTEMGKLAASLHVMALAPDGQSLLIIYTPLDDPSQTLAARVGLNGTLWQNVYLPPEPHLLYDYSELETPSTLSYDLLIESHRSEDPMYDAVYRYDWTTNTTTHLADIERWVMLSIGKAEGHTLLLINPPVPEEMAAFVTTVVQFDTVTGAVSDLPIEMTGFPVDYWADTRQVVLVEEGHLMTYQLDTGAIEDWGENVGVPRISPCRDVWVADALTANQASAPLIRRKGQRAVLDRLPNTIDRDSLRWWRLPAVAAYGGGPSLGGGALLTLVGLGWVVWRGGRARSRPNGCIPTIAPWRDMPYN